MIALMWILAGLVVVNFASCYAQLRRLRERVDVLEKAKAPR